MNQSIYYIVIPTNYFIQDCITASASIESSATKLKKQNGSPRETFWETEVRATIITSRQVELGIILPTEKLQLLQFGRMVNWQSDKESYPEFGRNEKRRKTLNGLKHDERGMQFQSMK
jgi:hypothetical protein